MMTLFPLKQFSVLYEIVVDINHCSRPIGSLIVTSTNLWHALRVTGFPCRALLAEKYKLQSMVYMAMFLSCMNKRNRCKVW